MSLCEFVSTNGIVSHTSVAILSEGKSLLIPGAGRNTSDGSSFNAWCSVDSLGNRKVLFQRSCITQNREDYTQHATMV